MRSRRSSRRTASAEGVHVRVRRSAGVVALALALALAGCGASQASRARQAAARFAATWTAGTDAAAAAQTDDPRLAGPALSADRRGLDGAALTARAVDLKVSGRAAAGQLELTWRVPGYGDWSYPTPLALREDAAGAWQVVWSPRLAQPSLTATTRLGTERVWAPRASIVDRDGRPLVSPRPVVEVGLARNKVTDVAASVDALAGVLSLDAGALAQQVRGAGPDEFVVAETFRPADYAAVAPKLAGIPGLTTVDATLPLAPTKAFGRALLGAVGPATAQQVAASNGRLVAGDDAGQWGLEAAYDGQLAGTPTVSIIVREKSTGAPLRTLAERAGTPPQPLATTLSTGVQSAAEAALGNSTAAAAVVALQPSTGDILAVANRPTSSTFDRALAGSYAPGSTFKVITTAALLRGGLDAQQLVACPTTITVDGRVFQNYEGEGGPGSDPSFADDFAISCNTAFISLAPRLSAAALPATALDFGLGRNADLPFGAAESHVPPGTDAVGRAAMMIGQDQIVATPLAMAGVAATVANGRWRSPRLLVSDPSVAGPALPPSEDATLHTLMRGVVTHGTGTALAATPGGVDGKTGTAEFGTADPPATHAWFICFRGDLALAVLVERGQSGGTVAAPIAARFFAAYDALHG
jgi:cell division protein FtsI/penicillin-binding protein 2